MRAHTFAPLSAALMACSFQGPSTDETSFACTPVTQTCPAGYACDDGLCVRGVGDADASPSPIDAALLADAPPGTPDSAPPPPGSKTLIFGDHSIATVKGTLFDTFIDQGAPNATNGGSDFASADTDPTRYALMRIDVSQIPAGSTVESAEIVITLFDAQEDGRLEAQVLLRAWSERNATFNVADNGTSWPTPGAAGNSIDDTVVAATEARQATDEVITLPAAVVQAWVDSPATNFGLRWRSSSPTNRGCQWHSRENAVATRRPYLRVTYR